MNRSHFMLTMLVVASSALLSVGCGPDYPTCDTDGDCHEGEFCVNGQCQQCREDSDCGAGQACNGGRCDDIPGYCSSNTDCPAGHTCVNNACVAPEGFCASDADCPEGRECVDNVCVESAESANSCSLETIYFPFDSSDLSTEARDSLVNSKACISRRQIAATQVIGFTDPRGTEEYNLALGDRRARSVASYLQSLGVASASLHISSMGEEMASGTDDASWVRDRRVELEPR